MIISIDPGVTNCGVNVMSRVNGDYIVHESVNVVGGRKIKGGLIRVQSKYGERTAKIFRIVDTLEELLIKYPKVDSVVLEAPFYNSRRPVAFAALLEVVFCIKMAFTMKHDLDFHLIEPSLIKKIFTGKGNANKDQMKDALITKLSGKDIKLPKPINEMTEHEIDASGIGYSYYNKHTIPVEEPKKKKK